MTYGMIFALLAFAGVFLFFIGLSQMRRSAGGSEDFQARLAAYGVTTAGATTLPPATGARDMLKRRAARADRGGSLRVPGRHHPDRHLRHRRVLDPGVLRQVPDRPPAESLQWPAR